MAQTQDAALTNKTVVGKGSKGETIYKSTVNIDYPKVDILTLLFDSPRSLAKEDTILHADAANPSSCLTKAQCRTYTRRFAHTLRNRYGIGANGPNRDLVTVISSGLYCLPLTFYGVVAAGGVSSCVSAASTPKELARLILSGKSRVLICNNDTQEVAVAAAREAKLPLDRVLLLEGGDNITLKTASTGSNVLGVQELDWQRITSPQALDDSLVCLIYSSGTTGLPKGVQLSHTNLVSQVTISCDPWRAQLDKRNPGWQVRTLAHLPVAHIAGLQGYLVNPFYMGGTTYWMPRFNWTDFLSYNKLYKITYFFTVPPIWLLIAKSAEVTDHFDDLMTAISGAAPLGRETQLAASKKLGKKYGGIVIAQTWGLSETTGSTTILPYGEQDLTGSVSKLLASTAARIVDDEGRDVEVGKAGEIWVKGPIVFKGYYENDAANKEAFSEDGWFCTGDIGLFDESTGLFYIVDRKKELIKYKGLQVAPAELEALLISHPKILDAAVIGVDIAEGTEAPRAYVVVDPKSGMDEANIKQFVKENVAGHKQLRGGVVFVEAVPKSPSGKILRKDLREAARREGKAKL
ncbi:hypothetical protein LTS18_004795 [Coniosporium uncinatum]|uniref:Uncharacterized protein n=1 Tax=Coniosporium uncinatum TaxID=93489 RepID=A0ACC3DYJ9_9PEZI|nr:hypothetical protein LTS18_004795 [Coniosporium uncinatum]